MGRIKQILGRTLLAASIFAGYYMFYNHFDTQITKSMSQKKGETVIGLDFEAYNKQEPLDVRVPKKGDSMKDIKNVKIDNWSYLSSYEITDWMRKTFANTVSFTPYYGDLSEAEKNGGKFFDKGDTMIKDLLQYITSPERVILRIKGDKKCYEQLKEKDPLTIIAKKLAKSLSESGGVAIELEAPDDGDYKMHNERINLIKNISPKIKVAVTLDKKEGYDENSRLWDPEKGRNYWENADIIILEDYFSNPTDLEKSIKIFKDAVRGHKQIWVRVVTGSKRVNEKGIKSLEAEVEEYEKLIEVTRKYADGCMANDYNGTWLFSSKSYDKSERLDTTKRLYKKFRGIKFNKEREEGNI